MTNSNDPFIIHFGDDRTSSAITAPTDVDPQVIIQAFGLSVPRPTIFISGGASAMSEEDIERTRTLIDECIAEFAQQKAVTVIDGGTEAGVMDMIGDARRDRGYHFPLIGVAPRQKVEYPGFKGTASEAVLQDGHSHFVLVESDEWGGETNTIITLTKAIASQQAPMVGILINGGKIAEREAYLASAIGENRMPLIIIDGSGRTADNISTAFKTQRSDSAIIRAIIKGADLRLTALYDGKPALRQELDKIFADWQEPANTD